MNTDAPMPKVEATFSVEPHPDPLVQALIEEIEKLRARNEELEICLAAERTKWL